MIYIIGGMGYVGSGFTRYCRAHGLPHQVITRDNYQEFAGTGCDVLVKGVRKITIRVTDADNDTGTAHVELDLRGPARSEQVTGRGLGGIWSTVMTR